MDGTLQHVSEPSYIDSSVLNLKHLRNFNYGAFPSFDNLLCLLDSRVQVALSCYRGPPCVTCGFRDAWIVRRRFKRYVQIFRSAMLASVSIRLSKDDKCYLFCWPLKIVHARGQAAQRPSVRSTRHCSEQ